MKFGVKRLTASMLRLHMVTLCILSVASAAAAQEFRGVITGTVTDATGAVVPNAVVTATNQATNVTTTATSTDQGSYTINFLIPGLYTVLTEASGFKRLVRQNVEVRVGDKLALDFLLETGGVQETVTVASDTTPLLNSESATLGQVIDRRRISELPLQDGNPYTLTQLAAGITYNSGFQNLRPFDLTQLGSIRANGAPGGNEFTVDGIPTQTGGFGSAPTRPAYAPPADAVEEFKVETVQFDAQQGHTAGANVNITLRSGQNRLFGTVYDFIRNDALSGNNFFLNRNSAQSNLDENNKAIRPPLRYNRFGATVGGPVYLPRFGEGGPAFSSGRDRTFFFFAFEGLRQTFPTPFAGTVPTVAQRGGDFSALLAQGIQIYDPLTAREQAGNTVRTAFPGNIIPANRLSPIARSYLQFVPLPNAEGDAQGRNIFVSSNPSTERFYSYAARVDHTFNEKHKTFFRYSFNNRDGISFDTVGQLNGVRSTGAVNIRTNTQFAGDYVWTATPTFFINVRGGFSRYNEDQAALSRGEINVAQLGFSPQTVALLPDPNFLPRFNIDNITFSNIANNLGAFNRGTTNIYTMQPTATKIAGAHSFRFGYDFRVYQTNTLPQTVGAGDFTFVTDFTRQSRTAAGQFGQGLASFLLGLPTAGFIQSNVSPATQRRYHGLFVQDDYKVTRRLTLNLGLRYEYEDASTERYNRAIRGFDPDATNPVEAQARAAYAAAYNANPAAFPSRRRTSACAAACSSPTRGTAPPATRTRTTFSRGSARRFRSTTRRSCAAVSAFTRSRSGCPALTRQASRRTPTSRRRSTTA